jgi:hypothetical protein
MVVPPALSSLQVIMLELNAWRSFYQAALSQHTSSFLQTLRHRHGSEPSTGFEGSGHQPVGDFSNFICGSPTMYLLDTALKLLKPTFCEAPPLRLHASQVPLQPFADDPFPGGVFGFVSLRDLDVTDIAALI